MKEFITMDTVRDSALKLCNKIYREDKFLPDIMYVPLRGGAYVGNVFSEYYKIVCDKDNKKPVQYAALVARSYSDVRCQSKVSFDGWTYPPEKIRAGDKILITDDIFDTGKTLNVLTSLFMKRGIPREDIKIAVFDYKIPNYKNTEPLPIQPDYWCRKHVMNDVSEDNWIHYLSHEFIGLTDEEIDRMYKDPEVRKILKSINK